MAGTILRPERRNVVVSGSPTYNAFENPAVPLQAVGFDDVFGSNRSDAGETVTPDTASTVGTFYRCLFLLSSVVGACPIEVFRKRDHQLIENDLFDEANDEMTFTPFELMQLVMVYRLIWGDSFVYKKRDGNEQIIDLKPLYPDLVEIDFEKDPETGELRKIFKVKKRRADGSINETAKPYVYTDFDVMHIPNVGLNGVTGLSVVNCMAQSLGTAIAADKLAAKFYSKGTQLGGIIKIKAPLKNQAQAEGIKARWMSKNAGVAHAGEVAILDAETDFQSVTIPPDQLQFLESRKWQTTEIARWFGVPPHLVGDVEKSTSWGTGIETQNLGLNTYTLNGHITPIEQRFTREVVQTRGHVARFNLDSMMRGTTQERYAALATAVGGPWMSVNEARIAENKKPKGSKYDEILPPQGIGPPQDQDSQGPAEDTEQGAPSGEQDSSGS
jgi:HK97 family phage portal protein